jgi:DNA-binding HxlR family transcriptional regulator
VTRARRPRSACPISLALEIFGDAWSLLVVRDLMFKGRKTFRELLEAGEGIATNVLSERLVRLETHGLLERARDPEDARRQIYRLTPKGMDLAPVLVEMVLWSAAHLDTDAPPRTVEAMRSDRDAFLHEVHAAWRAATLPGRPRAPDRSAVRAPRRSPPHRRLRG